MKFVQVFHLTMALGWTAVGIAGIADRSLAQSVPMVFFMSAYSIVGFHVVAFTQHRAPVQMVETLVEHTTLEGQP